MNTAAFPIDLNKFEPLKLDPAITALTDAQKAALRHNIQLCRDTIVFFTALAGAKGLSGHTGGAYDTVPEVMIIRAFIAEWRAHRADFLRRGGPSSRDPISAERAQRRDAGARSCSTIANTTADFPAIPRSC